MKGYQISQYDLPFAVSGRLDIEVDSEPRAIGVQRVHLEEDVAKMQHFPWRGRRFTGLVDVNRSGVPLMEIVSEPDMRSAEEARAYLVTLHSLLQYLGVTTGNMQDGSFRCDANISIRPTGSREFGNRTEIKNMNSFRSVFQAPELRGRPAASGAGRRRSSGAGNPRLGRGTSRHRFPSAARKTLTTTVTFLSPTFRPLTSPPSGLMSSASAFPNWLPSDVSASVKTMPLPDYDARLLTSSKAMADFFESAVKLRGASGAVLPSHAKQVSNWMLGDLSGLLNQENRDISESPVSPDHLVELIGLVDDGTISVTMAKTVLEETYSSGGSPALVVVERGLHPDQRHFIRRNLWCGKRWTPTHAPLPITWAVRNQRPSFSWGRL